MSVEIIDLAVEIERTIDVGSVEIARLIDVEVEVEREVGITVEIQRELRLEVEA